LTFVFKYDILNVLIIENKTMSNQETEKFEESVREAELEESPIPEEEVSETMTFGEAIQQALSNKRISRKAWGTNQEYGHFVGDFLHIFKDGKDHTWIISKGDVCEEDWISF
jgi:hypothetical protein